jgi:hypothetical protein
MSVDRLTVLKSINSLYYPKHTQNHMKKARKRRSGNYTSNPTSGDDLLALESSAHCTPPPMAALHPKIDKQETISMLFHI